jgi:transcriptional regulator with XRE-family HTH domain
MSDPNTLGSLVRKRRLESGYSLGQLASKVGKTAAEVRAWERDAELPEHGIIERLASTLEIDVDEIKKRLEAGKKALEAERKAAAKAEAEAKAAEVAAEAEAAEAEANAAAEAKAAAEVKAKKTQTPAVPETAGAGSEAPVEEEDLPGFAVEDPFTPPPPVAGRTPAGGPRAGFPADVLDAPTEPVPVPVITETATAARAGRAAALLEEPPPSISERFDAPDEDPGLLRYLEPLRVLFDPQSRYLYWIRSGLTIVVMMIFAVILFSQLGKLLDAIGELIDTIKPATNNTDQVGTVGMILFFL